MSLPSLTTGRSDRHSALERLSRDHVVALLLLLLALLATVTWSYVLELSTWRLDRMQAADRAGLYLFFLNPCYAAVSAWSSVQARQTIGDLTDGLPAPALVWRRSWWAYAGLGLIAHLLVLILVMITAQFSGAVGMIEPLAVLVQLASIPFFSALGALAGGLAVSRLTPPAVLLVLLAANTLLIQYGFRRISDVGTGSADFLDLRLTPAYLLPKLVLFLCLTAFAWPLRWWAVGRRGWLRITAAVLAVAAVLWVLTRNSPAQVYEPSPLVCHETGHVQVCVPQELAALSSGLDPAVDRTAALVASVGAQGIPSRVVVVSRGATSMPQGAVAVTMTVSAMRQDQARQRAVDFGYAYAQNCDDPTNQSGPPENVLLTRALLDGWLQYETGSVQPGSYPQENLDALLALSPTKRTVTLRRLFTAVWACDDHIAGLGPTR